MDWTELVIFSRDSPTFLKDSAHSSAILRPTLTLSPVLPTTFVTWDVESSRSVLISSAAFPDIEASLPTSSATTEKPLPCTPARAASMLALKASNLVSKTMSLMTLVLFLISSMSFTMSWSCSFAWCISPMAPVSFPTTSLPLWPSLRPLWAISLESSEFLLVWLIMEVISSMEATVSSMAAACCVVASENWWDAFLTWSNELIKFVYSVDKVPWIFERFPEIKRTLNQEKNPTKRKLNKPKIIVAKTPILASFFPFTSSLWEKESNISRSFPRLSSSTSNFSRRVINSGLFSLTFSWWVFSRIDSAAFEYSSISGSTFLTASSISGEILASSTPLICSRISFVIVRASFSASAAFSLFPISV